MSNLDVTAKYLLPLGLEKHRCCFCCGRDISKCTYFDLFEYTNKLGLKFSGKVTRM